jgi:hypothetical protein
MREDILDYKKYCDIDNNLTFLLYLQLPCICNLYCLKVYSRKIFYTIGIYLRRYLLTKALVYRLVYHIKCSVHYLNI